MTGHLFKYDEFPCRTSKDLNLSPLCIESKSWQKPKSWQTNEFIQFWNNFPNKSMYKEYPKILKISPEFRKYPIIYITPVSIVSDTSTPSKDGTVRWCRCVWHDRHWLALRGQKLFRACFLQRWLNLILKIKMSGTLDWHFCDD